ncbi:MAG: hypothetical protein R3E13_03915 [Alphaproteobacteria bacterium]
MDFQEGFITDNAFMLAFAQAYAPRLVFNISGIEWIAKYNINAFIPKLAAGGFRKFRAAFQKVFYFALGLKPSRCKTFHGFA